MAECENIRIIAFGEANKSVTVRYIIIKDEL